MKLIVFGATGKTGMEVVRQALAEGHEVTAFVRDPSKMSLTDERLRLAAGDALDLGAVTSAVMGHDAVVCSLGSNSLGKSDIRSAGTDNIIKGMDASQVTRLIAVTAMGVAESWPTLSFAAKAFFSTVLRNVRIDHEEQEALIRASKVAWTIVRPSGLTDGPRTGQYDAGENIRAKSSQIARADVADFILKELDSGANIGKAITVTN